MGRSWAAWPRTGRVSRPLVLAFAAICTAGALFGIQARAADAIEQKDIEIAAVRDPQLGAQVAIADAYGYFKDEGLNVTVRWNQSGADIITLMAGGSQNIGTGGTFAEVIFAGQNLPVRIVSALADISATQGFALSPGVKLASPKELEGKKLAHTQGNSQVLILAKMAKMYGFDMGKVTLVNMNPSEGIVAASKGDVQGLLGWQPNLFRLVGMGGTMYATGTTLYTTGTAQPLPFDDRLQYNHSALLASQAWIDQKPNTLKAVLRALKKSTDLLHTDREKALTALQQQLRIDLDALKVMVEANQYGLAIDEALAKSVVFQSEWALNVKRIPGPTDMGKVFGPEPLRAVDPALVSWKPGS